jgi:hypothetical protein
MTDISQHGAGVNSQTILKLCGSRSSGTLPFFGGVSLERTKYYIAMVNFGSFDSQT